MKSLFIFIVLFITYINNAQVVLTVPLEGSGSRPYAGAYYKDTNNVFAKFSGTWKYEDLTTNTSLTIILQKVTNWYDISHNEYIDMIKGEYKYISNGVELANTFNNINTSNPYNNNISGTLIKDRNLTSSERRLELQFIDPEREYLNYYIWVKYIAATNTTPEQIKIHFVGDTSSVTDETLPLELRVPEQDYILTKQP